jgi:hypothetical protein
MVGMDRLIPEPRYLKGCSVRAPSVPSPHLLRAVSYSIMVEIVEEAKV